MRVFIFAMIAIMVTATAAQAGNLKLEIGKQKKAELVESEAGWRLCNREGRITVKLFDKEAEWLKEQEDEPIGEPAFQKTVLAHLMVDNPARTFHKFKFKNVPPGKYVVIIHHDVVYEPMVTAEQAAADTSLTERAVASLAFNTAFDGYALTKNMAGKDSISFAEGSFEMKDANKEMELYLIYTREARQNATGICK